MIVALGRAVTGQRISTLVPMTVVMFPPITILTSLSPLTATMFSSGLVIVGALPSKQRIRKHLFCIGKVVRTLRID